jgi:thiol-disulfide isomerase/thioredoxin
MQLQRRLRNRRTDEPIMKTSLPNSKLAPRISEISLKLHPRQRNGESVSLPLTTLAGRVVVLFVFGVDCGTCKHLASVLSDFHHKFAPHIEFIGICVQSGCEEKLETFRAAFGLKLPLAHCSIRQLCAALHIPPATWLFYPTLIFIDAAQRMRGYFVGGDSFFEDYPMNLPKVLEELLGERGEHEASAIREAVEVRA